MEQMNEASLSARAKLRGLSQQAVTWFSKLEENTYIYR